MNAEGDGRGRTVEAQTMQTIVKRWPVSGNQYDENIRERGSKGIGVMGLNPDPLLQYCLQHLSITHPNHNFDLTASCDASVSAMVEFRLRRAIHDPNTTNVAANGVKPLLLNSTGVECRATPPQAWSC
ncbi:Phage integrase [Sesbania bispinosa]|nr:Phage integrase [Sesbania bispinosa]